MNVLISSSGRRGALVQIFGEATRQLQPPGRVICADASRLTAAGHLADELVVVPRCHEGRFLATLRDLCRRREIGLLVPTIDPELSVYSAARDQFAEDGTTVLVSSPATVALTADKRRTHQWLVEQGLPTVRTASLSDALEDRSWQFPVMVKPVAGSASVGAALSYSRSDLASRCGGEDLIVQAVAPGDEYTADALVGADGSCRCVVLRKRLEVRAGEVSKALTVRDARLQDLVRRVVEALPGAFGPITVQLFVSGTDVNIIEVNPRFGGGFPLSWAAGANFARWIIEGLLGLPSTARSDEWQDGLLMLRYDAAVFVAASEARS